MFSVSGSKKISNRTPIPVFSGHCKFAILAVTILQFNASFGLLKMKDQQKEQTLLSFRFCLEFIRLVLCTDFGMLLLLDAFDVGNNFIPL